MTFFDFSQELLQPLEQTSSKLEMTQRWADFLHKLEAKEVKAYLYLSLGQMGPTYDNPQFNFGLEFLLYALALLPSKTAQDESGSEVSLFGEEVVKKTERKKALKARYKQLGDIGKLAQEVVADQPKPIAEAKMSVADMFNRLLELTTMNGEGSQENKIQIVAKLLKELDPLSARYIARIILGTLRFGFSDATLLDAFSWYLKGDKSLRTQFDEIYQRHPDIGVIGEKVLAGGVESAQKIDVTLGVPVLPALCDRLKSADEMIAKMGEVFVEPKYDGTRVQIHWDAKTRIVRTFTRNLEESTLQFPELARLLEDLKAKSVILDSEAVGYDPETNKLVTFQQTMKRKRKHDIEATMAAIPLKFFVFDILLLDGKSTLSLPLTERKKLLEKIFPQKQRDLQLDPAILTMDPNVIRVVHAKQLAAGFEGAVIKRSNSVYQPGRQDFTWVKFKESEGTTAKLTDTIDAVVVGYYYGRGKRTVFGVGAFLIAIRDEKNSKLLTIAKIGTGLSDEQWRELKTRADDLIARKGTGSGVEEGYELVVPELLVPDVMLPLELVVEVAADEITKSPTHTAGIALRFPRLVNFRDDKSVSQITTLEEMKKIRVA